MGHRTVPYLGWIIFSLFVIAITACGGNNPTPVGPDVKTNPKAVATTAEPNVLTGTTVVLDGSNSSDPEGDSLSYKWVLVSKPSNSNALLSNPDQKSASFVADASGEYKVNLTVNDGKTDSSPATVVINANTLPIATTTKGNNSARLSGAVIGKGTAAVSDLRKQIAVTILGTNPSFTVGTAFATRSRTSTDYAHIILPVTNSGTQTRCFVKLAGVTYRDASGAAIGVPGLAFVSGSVGKVSSAIFTDTCLAPGETGMVADIEADLYTAVTKMEFTFEIPSFTISVPIASVIPQSYSYTDVLAINVKNVGLGPAQIASNVVGLSKLFLLDDLGQPLMWNFYSTPSVTNIPVPSVIVPVSGTATMTGSSSYDGSASKLLVFVDFEDASVTANLKRTFGIEVPASEVCAASLPEDELMLCWNEIRNQRLDSLKSFYDTHQGSTP